jgi:hypothetical protein
MQGEEWRSAVLSIEDGLKAVLDAAERLVQPPVACAFLPFHSNPKQWSPAAVRLARALVRNDTQWNDGIWDFLAETFEFYEGDSVTKRFFKRDANADLIAAWSTPIGKLLKSSTQRMEEPVQEFHLTLYTANRPGLDSTVQREAIAVTTRLAVVTVYDDVENHPWFPVPSALVSRDHLLQGVGIALREEGGFWLGSAPNELRSNLGATELYRLLLFASRILGDEVWKLSIPDLAAVDVPGADWGYVDLVDALADDKS